MLSNNNKFFNRNNTSSKRNPLTVKGIYKYFALLTLKIPHNWLGVLGFGLFLIMAWQIVSGFVLAMGYIPEPMYIPASRDTDDLEGLHVDDMFWFHERGVDLLFIFFYSHFLRKLFLNTINQETESSWKSGALAFLVFQVVVFFGLVLCSTHLSEITLRIASNILVSLMNFTGKLEWIIFTDKTLNADCMVRMMIFHYLSAGFLLCLGFIHGIDMHYDWKVETTYLGLKETVVWYDEGLTSELVRVISLLCLLIVFVLTTFRTQEPINYELFTWGDLGIVTDVNYLAVAPHWYFRPFMAWLTVVPDHYLGISGLLLYFMAIYFQPNLVARNPNRPVYGIRKNSKGDSDETDKYLPVIWPEAVNSQYSVTHYTTFALFFISLWYTASFLPYGKFFHRIGGNFGLILAYTYIFIYLMFPSIRVNGIFGIFRTLLIRYRFYKFRKKIKAMPESRQQYYKNYIISTKKKRK